ncbi:unnamed protein product [Larinioides sclopetarius]|uniref:Uncharacterized protein n=1 Tax=Larinioides sclopetarius TaxID=280406 RepID=A0AAV2BZ42_9ARAC
MLSSQPMSPKSCCRRLYKKFHRLLFHRTGQCQECEGTGLDGVGYGCEGTDLDGVGYGCEGTVSTVWVMNEGTGLDGVGYGCEGTVSTVWVMDVRLTRLGVGYGCEVNSSRRCGLWMRENCDYWYQKSLRIKHGLTDPCHQRMQHPRNPPALTAMKPDTRQPGKAVQLYLKQRRHRKKKYSSNSTSKPRNQISQPPKFVTQKNSCTLFRK